MKNVALIVDPFSSGALYADALIKRDITPVAILSHCPILNIYRDSFKPSDFKFIFTCNSYSQLLSELTEFLKDKNLVTVLPGTESGVELADKISEVFCPVLSNGTLLTSCRRNKFDMSEKLRQSNVVAPKTIKSKCLQEILDWIRCHKLLPTGVVLKPLNSAGTDGVTACFNESELAKAFERNLNKLNQFNIINEYLLVQEYLNGTEYVVDTVSVHGKHVITNICSYKKTNANNSNFVYDYLDFMPQIGELQNILSEYTYKVLDSLGIKYGPAHSEIMMTEKGPHLIETGIRLHGGVAIQAARLATGNSQLDYTLDSFTRNAPPSINHIGFTLKRYTRIVFLISYFESMIKAEHQNLEFIKKLESFVTLKLNVRPGIYLKKTIDLFSMPGLLILSDESLEQVQKDYTLLRELEQDGLFVLAT